jgi:hypothetical protein
MIQSEKKWVATQKPVDGVQFELIVWFKTVGMSRFLENSDNNECLYCVLASRRMKRPVHTSY